MENSFLSDNNVEDRVSNIEKYKKVIFYAVSSIILFFSFYFFFFSSPADFPVGAVIKIEPGMSVRSVSALLEKEHIIKSRVFFESFIIIFGGELRIKSADYLFEKTLPVWQVARRIEKGEHHMAPVSVTIPEGFDSKQIADTFAKELVNFNKDKFLAEAKNKEGYLFPDTYFFLTNEDEKDVIKSMTNNFEKKIAPLQGEIFSSGKKRGDIITMASIIEKEAKGDADREIISGILWRRISIGMPLQVDASMDTYKTKGLPGSPIGNPGLLAIEASLYPKSSPYLYYLHDKNGIIHYAKTFAEHRNNITKYLK